jgi:hypothetical protein
MRKMKLLVCLALAASLALSQAGCTASGCSGGAHAELDLGIIKAGVSVGFNAAGEKVFVMANPTDTDGWVQPVDSDGNPIGDPIPFPAGGIIELPPGTDITKTHLVKKPTAPAPAPKPKPAPEAPGSSTSSSFGSGASSSRMVTIAPAVMQWGGGTTSFGDDGSSSTAEYSIAATDNRSVFQTLALLDQGASPANAELVCRTSLTPATRNTASLNLVLPANDVSGFEVYLNGVLVASSATGLGNATVTYSTDGFGYGSATIPFSTAATNNSLQVITIDHIGVPRTRSMSYGM